MFIFSGNSSRHDTTSPTDTACSSESPAFLGPSQISLSNSLMYDQHSSEEELEVINGPSSGTADEHCDEIFDEESPKRSNSTIIENRKRSLAQASDDEVSKIYVLLSQIFH